MLRIRDWATVFENASSRKLTKLHWVAMPVDMSGAKYAELVTHERGAEHFAAWCAIVEIAANQDPRGSLPKAIGRNSHDVGGICQSLGRISHLPVRIFQEAIPRLIDDLQWIENIDVAVPLGESANALGESANVVAENQAYITLHNTTEQNPFAPENPALVVSAPLTRPPRKKALRTTEQLKVALGDRVAWWDALWAIYPCRDGMKAGLETFERMVHTRELAVEIFKGAERYAAKSKADPTMKLKYLQGWLNDERWRDANQIPLQAVDKNVQRHEDTLSAMKFLSKFREVS
jgi:hypothetical protein